MIAMVVEGDSNGHGGMVTSRCGDGMVVVMVTLMMMMMILVKVVRRR